MRVNNFLNNINFGQTRIISDFDGTYMPDEFNHDKVCNNKPELDCVEFSKYFSDFQDFIDENSIDEPLKLTISTGRNRHEFNYFMQKLKERSLKIPVPDSLIIVNGGDEYISKNKNYFDSSDEVMFEAKNRCYQKDSKISQFFVSFDLNSIFSKMLDFFTPLLKNTRFYTCKTHQGAFGYKDDMTLQSKLEKDDFPTDYISIRDDGFYQYRLSAPVGSQLLDKLADLPVQIMEEGNCISYDISENNQETFVNSIENPRQIQAGTSIEFKPLTYGKIKVLDKFHHAKIEIDETMKNQTNDLIILCGDGGNDLNMLDLSNYCDDMKSSYDYFAPESSEFRQSCPAISVFVRNKESHDKDIFELEKNLNKDGIKRFIIVDKNNPNCPKTLLEGLKLAQEEYLKINPNYRK